MVNMVTSVVVTITENNGFFISAIQYSILSPSGVQHKLSLLVVQYILSQDSTMISTSYLSER